LIAKVVEHIDEACLALGAAALEDVKIGIDMEDA
jgi:hypothetical protein